MSDHNGWTNKQTWNINLNYSDVFANMCEEQTFEDVEHLAGAFESLVDELEYNELKAGSLAQQAVGEYLCAVDWEQIAEHYASDFDLFKDEEQDQEEEDEHDYVSEMRCRVGNK